MPHPDNCATSQLLFLEKHNFSLQTQPCSYSSKIPSLVPWVRKSKVREPLADYRALNHSLVFFPLHLLLEVFKPMRRLSSQQPWCQVFVFIHLANKMIPHYLFNLPGNRVKIQTQLPFVIPSQRTHGEDDRNGKLLMRWFSFILTIKCKIK